MHDMGGRPWQHWDDIYRALGGGHQTMRSAGAVPLHVRPLQLEAPVAVDLPGGAFNPSLCVHDDRLLFVVRQRSRLLLSVFSDPDMGFDMTPVSGRYAPHEREPNPVRLFSWEGRLWGLGCTADYTNKGTPHTQLALLRFDGAMIDEVRILSSDRYEKNWMPCVSDGRLRFVYSSDPLIVLDYPGDMATGSLPKTQGTLRGGSQLVRYGAGWIAIVHQTHDGGAYTHRLVAYDSALTSARVSGPFFLRGELAGLRVEFVAGLARWQDRFMLAFGVNDSEAWIASITDAVVDELLAGAAPVVTVRAPEPARAVLPPMPATAAPLAPFILPPGPPAGHNPLMGGWAPSTEVRAPWPGASAPTPMGEVHSKAHVPGMPYQGVGVPLEHPAKGRQK